MSHRDPLDAIRTAILIPFPDTTREDEPMDRQEKLKAIIENVEQHQNEVRANLLDEAQRRKEEIGHPCRPDVTSGASMLEPGHEEGLRNLNAQWDQSTTSSSTLITPPPYSNLLGPPPASYTSLPEQVAAEYHELARETIHQLDIYDKQAAGFLDNYKSALARGQGRRRSSAGNSPPQQPAHRSSGTGGSASATNSSSNLRQSSNDASRDPRLRRGSASGSPRNSPSDLSRDSRARRGSVGGSPQQTTSRRNSGAGGSANASPTKGQSSYDPSSDPRRR